MVEHPCPEQRLTGGNRLSNWRANDRPAIVTTESSQSCPLATSAEPARNCLIAACFTIDCSALRWALSCSLENYNHATFTLHNRRRLPHACRRRPHGLRPLDPNQERCGIASQSVKDMNTLSVSRHVCGHYCVRSSAEKNRRLIKPLHFVCYACRNLPGAELCRSCKVRGEWLDHHEINR